MLPTDLPPLALIAFGVTLALIFAINRFGFLQGKSGPVSGSTAAAQVAAVIVDPTALNKASDAVDGLVVAVTEGNVIARQHTLAVDRLAGQVEQLGEGIDRLRRGDPVGGEDEMTLADLTELLSRVSKENPKLVESRDVFLFVEAIIECQRREDGIRAEAIPPIAPTSP